MEYSQFYDRKKGVDEFKDLRNKLTGCIENPRSQNFDQLFSQVKEKALNGDVVAQDVVAYFYRDGVARYLREDYMKYMKWQILSASNGNKFAIDKLQFFLGYAYDSIVNNENFARIQHKNKIDEFNYIYVIGQRLCEQLVQDLNIDIQELAQSRDVFNPYKPEYFRDLRSAVDKAIPKVIEQMMK